MSPNQRTFRPQDMLKVGAVLRTHGFDTYSPSGGPFADLRVVSLSNQTYWRGIQVERDGTCRVYDASDPAKHTMYAGLSPLFEFKVRFDRGWQEQVGDKVSRFLLKGSVKPVPESRKEEPKAATKPDIRKKAPEVKPTPTPTTSTTRGNINTGGVVMSAKGHPATDAEIRQFIDAWAAGESVRSIYTRLGYPDKDKIQYAIEGETYPYVDPPRLHRPKFDELRRAALPRRLHVRAFGAEFDRLAWRLKFSIPDDPKLLAVLVVRCSLVTTGDGLDWNARRSGAEPGTPPPEGFRVDSEILRLSTTGDGHILVWDPKNGWKAPKLRCREGRADLIITVDPDHPNVNAAAAVLRTWEGPPPEPRYVVGYRDGNPKNLAVSNLEWLARR